MVVGKKEKGYLEGSNMDMGMDNYGIGVYGMEIDRTERVGLEKNPISDYNTVLKRLQM